MDTIWARFSCLIIGQGNHLCNLLGRNLSELKRLRRSSLTFFLKDSNHDAIRPLSSTTLCSITTMVSTISIQYHIADLIFYNICNYQYYHNCSY